MRDSRPRFSGAGRAKAAGLTVAVPAAPLQDVTITLTNVRFRTAVDAICDTAGCTWRLEGTTLKLEAAGGAPPAGALPSTVSVALEEVSVRDVFRAIGAAINVPVTVEGKRRPAAVDGEVHELAHDGRGRLLV